MNSLSDVAQRVTNCNRKSFINTNSFLKKKEYFRCYSPKSRQTQLATTLFFFLLLLLNKYFVRIDVRRSGPLHCCRVPVKELRRISRERERNMFLFLKKDQNRFCEVWVLKTTKPPGHQMLSEELRSHRSV